MSPQAARAGSVYLHVGEPKTGTTFLQLVMWTNRAELRQHGVIYPGPRANAHWRATQDLCEVRQEPGDPAPPFVGEWDRIVAQVRDAPCAGVISHELLATASPEQAERGLRSLEGTELHLVLTVRDFGSLLPAEWQESVKNRSTRPWRAWLGDVIDDESVRPDRRTFGFWRVHDTMDILETWSRGLPPERVHVITMPQRGGSTSLLWDRFANLIGIDPSVAELSRARANVSLGVAEIEMLRRLNETLPDSFPDWSYMWFVKDTLTQGAVSPRLGSGRLTLPAERREWACAQADEIVTALQKSGYDIIGDLDELVPRFGDETMPPDPGDAAAEDMLGAALDSMTVLLDKMEAMRIRGRAAVGNEANQPQPSGLKRALIRASERHRSVERMRIAYWRIRHLGRRLTVGRGTRK